MSSYDSFNNPNSALNKQSLTTQRLGPNAHDDLKSSIPKIDTPEQSPSKYQGGRWDQPAGLRHDHVNRHGMSSNSINEGRMSELNPDMSPRNSRDVDKNTDIMTLDQLSPRMPSDGRNHDMYR